MIKIVEVGPRDGLQNEKQFIPTEIKVQFIEKLVESGLKKIEATSFVSPKAIPQMADSREVYQSLVNRGINKKVELTCLVPNLKGLEVAKKLNVKEIALFTASSETFNKKNINASIKESLARLKDVANEAKKSGIALRGYLSTVFGCPYEGEIAFKKNIELIETLLDLGCYEVSLGDTIGIANPKQVKSFTQDLKKNTDLKKIAMHFHDTRGLALTNINASLDCGIEVFDSSAGGLGGCPYAKGATGNVATEDLWYLLESQGFETNINIDLLVEASSYILNQINKVSTSKFYHAYQAGQK